MALQFKATRPYGPVSASIVGDIYDNWYTNVWIPTGGIVTVYHTDFDPLTGTITYYCSAVLGNLNTYKGIEIDSSLMNGPDPTFTIVKQLKQFRTLGPIDGIGKGIQHDHFEHFIIPENTLVSETNVPGKFVVTINGNVFRDVPLGPLHLHDEPIRGGRKKTRARARARARKTNTKRYK